MKITYIAHSGFSVETDTMTLLFDYYKGTLPSFPADKPLYVFASHFHSDHFNPDIFQLAEHYPEVHYILSHDIWTSRKKYIRSGIPETFFEKAVILRAHETKKISADITVTTLRSTDMGVAFLIHCNGKTIYHAGDLNWWRWEGDTKQEIGNMEANFKREIQTLADTPIDIAFIPLDPRQETFYCLGMNYFLDMVSVRHVFPMHFWDDYKIVSRYLEEFPPKADLCFYPIQKEGEEWVLS